MPRLTRRRLLHGLAASAAAGALPRPSLAQPSDAARAAMAGAALAFLGALPAEARRRAVFPLGDRERLNWHYVPRGREGVPFKAMPAPARAAAHELMKASLSAVGYGKATNVIQLETVLRRIETFGLSRDPENYAFTVFGNPGAPAPWGWRVEGHHLSLNFTLVPGQPVAMTPGLHGREPGRGAVGAQEGPARPRGRAGSGPRARPEPDRDTARPHRHRGGVARRHRHGSGPRR